MDSPTERLAEALTDSNALLAQAALSLSQTELTLARQCAERVQRNAELIRETRA